MERRVVDILFFTNLPAFYKINLYNELAKRKRLLVIFSGDKSWERNEDFFNEDICFDYVALHGCIWTKWVCFLKILYYTLYSEVVVGGWDQLMGWLIVMVSNKSKNACAVESSIFESSTSGLKAIFKRLFLKRISKVYASGIPHGQLVRALGFNGEVKITGGCGILNYIPNPHYEARVEVKDFIYVGRFIDVKNLQMLILAFNELPQLRLHIVGFGPLEHELKSLAKDNVIFEGFVENKKLPVYYQKNDVFILPSYSEPWGLVVEEALNNGLPVIVSNKIGCSLDLVANEHGLIFDVNNMELLKHTVLKMTDITFYNNLRRNVATMNFVIRAKNQIGSYL